MEAIFSSKLYTLSKRKEKISSALKNPINKELILQLEDYLQIPEEDTANVDRTEHTSVPEEDFNEFVDHPNTDVDTKSDNSDTDSTKVVIKDKGSSKDHSTKVQPDETDITEDSVKEDSVDEDSNVEDTSSVSESTLLTKNTVTGATTLYTNSVEACCCPCHCSDAELVKGTLNAREDTQGVSRVTLQDRELWIYYQDKINLNNVMEPAIAVLNAANFNHLEFNRLARTQNAIVFDITCLAVDVKPIAEEDDE